MRVSAGDPAEIPADRCVAIAGGRAVVVRVGGEILAFENRCLHQDSPLAGGMVRDGILTCPFHFWRYHLPDGTKIGEEGHRLASYPVTVEQNEVVVELPEDDGVRSMRDLLLEHARTWERDRS